ncbi:flagellar basal-body MS-ring/collar protein FliF [Kineococcus glutinatus]|uniref:Flagellar M-ring protein n=1 Tax=Kineococcus glutinatus TaxID=1070872 RepID=A0ABP9HAG6_9ACTN
MATSTRGPANVVEGAKRFISGFAEFTAGQKAVVIAVVVALIGGGVVFSRWAATPSYAPMFSNLSTADASAIVEQLKASGTPYELADGGTSISVPQADVYETRLAMAKEGLPAESTSGPTMLEESSVTTSEFMEQKKYQQALAAELANTIESIDGVDNAIVNLAIPEEDVFIDEQEPTTASVLVGLDPGETLSDDQVSSIVNLVAGGVEGMDKKNVSVVDDEGNTLSVDGANTGAQQDEARDYNTLASTELQTMLEGIYGKGNVKATVNATLNFDEKTQTDRVYTYPNELPAQASTTSEETYTGGAGTAASGVLGPDNIQTPAEDGSTSGYTKKSATVDNPINQTDTVTRQAPGKVERMSVAVVLNSTKAGAADVNQVTQMVNAAVGIQAARGDAVSVIKTPFDSSAATATEAALAEAEATEQRETLVGYAKTAALALIVLVMLAVVLLSFRRRKVKTVDVLDVNDLPINVGDITAETAPVDEAAAAVEAHKPLALVGAPVDPALEAAAARRDEVVELVSRQPQEVAELLRGWLADRRS